MKSDYKASNGQIRGLQTQLIKSFLKAFIDIIKKEKPLITLKPGVKVFGSLYGQFELLLRIF